ncbi:hypothetical protein C8J56DRAFT_954230 [Mycena floridula]|nr:hypothetical protein C8J56DRAFT_954230 [Mycena floridula]
MSCKGQESSGKERFRKEAQKQTSRAGRIFLPAELRGEISYPEYPLPCFSPRFPVWFRILNPLELAALLFTNSCSSTLELCSPSRQPSRFVFAHTSSRASEINEINFSNENPWRIVSFRMNNVENEMHVVGDKFSTLRVQLCGTKHGKEKAAMVGIPGATTLLLDELAEALDDGDLAAIKGLRVLGVMISMSRIRRLIPLVAPVPALDLTEAYSTFSLGCATFTSPDGFCSGHGTRMPSGRYVRIPSVRHQRSAAKDLNDVVDVWHRILAPRAAKKRAIGRRITTKHARKSLYLMILRPNL